MEKRSGTMRTRPSSTASMAGFASGSIFMYHWLLTSGSTTSLQRSQWPRECCRGSIFSSSPSRSSSATMRVRASKRSKPS